MLNPLTRFTQELSDAPLFRFKQERPYIVAEVSRRVYRQCLDSMSAARENGLEYILNDAAYQEIERMTGGRGPEDEIASRSWWMGMSKELTQMSEQRKRDILKDLIERYASDVAGQFNPAVYKLTTGVLPFGLGMLFKAQDLQDLPRNFPQGIKELRDLGDRLVIDGDTDLMRSLKDKGTVLFVPTHSSNMDSILLGYSLWQAGLPPVTYGAGKNLFGNPLMSFFMHNLGAYKVDRRIKHDLYKEILKTYSQVLLERGYHSLFFPGGTRCRSNKVEQRLKLGLLGTSVSAYVRNLMQKQQDRRIYVCPVTINYNLVLEAESLIKDHLQAEGGRRYFLEDDEFDQLPTVLRFVMNTVRMEATTVIRFAEAFDPFGNTVEADGESYDARGHRVDPADYVKGAMDDQVTVDGLRDMQYTKHLGQRVASSFTRHTVLMPTQVVGYVLFELVRHRFKQWDIYRVMRMGGDEVVTWEALRAGVGRLMEVLERMAGRGELVLSEFLSISSAHHIAQEGIDYLRMYHVPAPLDFSAQGIVLTRMELLYFYSNRMRTYEIPAESWMPVIDV